MGLRFIALSSFVGLSVFLGACGTPVDSTPTGTEINEEPMGGGEIAPDPTIPQEGVAPGEAEQPQSVLPSSESSESEAVEIPVGGGELAEPEAAVEAPETADESGLTLPSTSAEPDAPQ